MSASLPSSVPLVLSLDTLGAATVTGSTGWVFALDFPSVADAEGSVNMPLTSLCKHAVAAARS